MFQIRESGDEVIVMKYSSRWLNPGDQKQLIAWFWKHKPAMMREIICEECPEHGEMTDKPYISEENINDLRGIAASMHRIGVIKNNTIDDCISELITYWMRDDV